MSIDALTALVPPPAVPLGARADRATSESLLGHALPPSVWEVIERYGDGSWADYLFMPSPHHAEGRELLLERAEDAHAAAPEARLLAFSEDGAMVVLTEGDEVAVISDGELRPAGMGLSELLVAWLSGEQDLLPPLAELTSDPSVPPFFAPSWDEARPKHLFEVFLRGESDFETRWSQFAPVLGAHRTWMRLQTGEQHQLRVYVEELELNLLFTDGSMHVWCYDDRLDEVRARLERAVREAGLVVHQVRAPKGFAHGFAITS
jgi:hypothetical protein